MHYPTSVLTLFLCTSQGMAQEVERFRGTDLPLTMKAEDLNDDYRPLKLKEQSSGIFGEYYSSSYFQFSSLGFSSSTQNPRFQSLIEILPVSWTRNDLLELYGQKFFVTYILEPSIEDLQQFSGGKPLRDTRLKLKLMKADQIGAIEPYPDLSKAKYIEILNQVTNKGPGVVSAALKTVAMSNLKQVALSAMMYLSDADDIFPYVQGTAKLQTLLRPYSRNDEIWQTKNPSGEGTFRFNMALAGVKAADIKEPAETPMLFDPIKWGDLHLVAYADGHARYVSEDTWQKMQKYFKMKLKRHGKPLK